MAIVSGWNRGTWNQGAWNTEIPVEVTGVSAAASAGSVTIAFITNITGVSATTSTGSPTLVTNSLLTPSGVSAATSVGSPIIWMTINTSQEPHFGAGDWSNISTTQTPSWTEIAA